MPKVTREKKSTSLQKTVKSEKILEEVTIPTNNESVAKEKPVKTAKRSRTVHKAAEGAPDDILFTDESSVNIDLKALLTENHALVIASGAVEIEAGAGFDIDVVNDLDDGLDVVLSELALVDPEVLALEVVDYVEVNDKLFSIRDEARAKHDNLLKKYSGKAMTAFDKHEVEVSKRVLDDCVYAIVEQNLGLVKIYVKRFLKQTLPENRADYEAAGMLGLMRAIDSYDRGRGRFSSWAWRPIVRDTLRAVRAAEYAYVNVGDFEKRPDILRSREALRALNPDVEPNTIEIATHAGVTTRQVDRVLRAKEHESLSKPIGVETDMTLGEVIEDPDVSVEEEVLYSMGLDALDHFGLATLEPRELFVLVRRFGLDGEPEQKLSKLGEVLNLSREAVRQVEGRALAKLSHPSVLRKIAREGRS